MSNWTALYFTAPLVAALVSGILLVALLRWRNIPLDRPNERSLHASPIPRIGGAAILPAIAVAWLSGPDAIPRSIGVSAALLFALSLLDDSRDIPVLLRLVAHFGAAAYVAAVLVVPQAGVLAGIVAMLAIAWMTNLYNFMDGSDGLAAGMTVIGFSGYAIAAWMGSDPAFASACFAIAAAVVPFLYCNFHPAKVFMGDSGSIPLGFFAASLGAEGWLRGLWPVWFPVLVFSPFVFDASVTLLRRFLRKEKIWRAHREHYYQRLVRLGWGHRRTAVAEYALMAICLLAALLGLRQPVSAQLTIFISCGLLYLLLALCIDRAWRRHEQET